jgi:hypothetical protein
MGKTLRNLVAGTMLALAGLLPAKANAQDMPDKINPFKAPDTSKTLVWDSLQTGEQREDSLESYLKQNKTNELPDSNCGDFARQLNMDFYGTPGYHIIPDSSLKQDTSHIGEFNVPLYYATRLGHAIDAVLIGDNPLNWDDWAFIEPQTDELMQPGKVAKNGIISIPLTTNLNIKYLAWFYDFNSKRNLAAELPFITFRLKDGKVDSTWYDTTRLVLTRNQQDTSTTHNSKPVAHSFIAPANNDTAKYNEEGKLRIEYEKATDADNDTLKYIIGIKGPGLDTLIETSDTSFEINSGLFQPGGRYSLEGKVTDGKQTVGFSPDPSVAFYAPSTTGVSDAGSGGRKAIPEKSSLSQSYPNPCNPSARIGFSLGKTEYVSLEVYDILGRKIKTLVNGHMPAGNHEVEFDASKLPSGVYIYRLQAKDFSETKKMVVSK